MQAAEARLALDVLPTVLWQALFALLPVDQRLRCREVCRDWRAALEERSLWTRLDLSEASGVAPQYQGWHRRCTGLLLAAAARAGGQLQSLELGTYSSGLDRDALRRVLRRSAALREIRVEGSVFVQTLAHLLRAAPQLRLLHAAELRAGD
jgi:hypothetical protein